MADLQSDSQSNLGGLGSQVQRAHLHRVMIDTPALLNMVKHCREPNAKGVVMGVLKDSITEGQ
jgi:hypothetical protein